MTPDEKFNQDVWYALKKIREQSLRRLQGEMIEYKIDIKSNNTSQKSEPIEEAKIIEKLIEWKALKKMKIENHIKTRVGNYAIYPLIYFYLEMIQPKFDELYEKFRKLAEKYQFQHDQIEKVFIPDQTNEIEKSMQREQMKQDRILRTPIDKYTHALNLIIERAEYVEDGNNFSIKFYDFNFERMIGSKMLEKFLTEMQKGGCFEKYTRTNYAGGTRFGFIKPNIKKFKAFKEKKEKQKIKINRFNEKTLRTEQSSDKLKSDINKKIKAKAKYNNGILYFKDKKIDFRNKQNQKELLITLFKEPTKNWYYDEIQEDWDNLKKLNLIKYPKNYWKKFYSAGNDINTAVAIEAQIKDFIIKNTREIRINPKYI